MFYLTSFKCSCVIDEIVACSMTNTKISFPPISADMTQKLILFFYFAVYINVKIRSKLFSENIG